MCLPEWQKYTMAEGKIEWLSVPLFSEEPVIKVGRGRDMSEKIVKYEYEYGLCKRMHYRGLWCVRYEGVPGHFEKAGMACSCAVDGCDKDCAVMESADAVIDPEWEWHMLDNPPGR